MSPSETKKAEAKLAIIQVIGAIPSGRVCTYGRIAKRAGMPNHARFVGTVLKQLPTDSLLPWHRVINSKGQISFPDGSEKQQLQRAKLEQEGVVFTGNTVKLNQYLW